MDDKETIRQLNNRIKELEVNLKVAGNRAENHLRWLTEERNTVIEQKETIQALCDALLEAANNADKSREWVAVNERRGDKYRNLVAEIQGEK